jgi:hypothetical protein
VQADTRVSIAQLKIRFNISWGTIVHESLGYRKVCLMWVPVNWPTNKKIKTLGVILDASSALRAAWWSILNQNCYRRWDLSLLLRPREQGSCLSGDSKETQGGYSAQETRIVDQSTRSSSFARQCSTSQCCRNRESLELLGLGNSSTPTTQSWLGTIGLPSIPKDKKKSTSEVSASTSMKVFKVKSRNDYVPRTHFFLW